MKHKDQDHIGEAATDIMMDFVDEALKGARKSYDKLLGSSIDPAYMLELINVIAQLERAENKLVNMHYTMEDILEDCALITKTELLVSHCNNMDKTR